MNIYHRMITFPLSFWRIGAKPPVSADPTLEIWYDFADQSTITLGTGTEITSVNDKSTGTVKPGRLSCGITRVILSIINKVCKIIV